MEQVTGSYESLRARISERYPHMSGQLKRIARLALERPNDLALGTVAAVAQAAEVQPSAVIRFANALNYKGFSEMQQVFRENLLDRSDNYRERITQMKKRQSQDGENPAGILHRLVDEAICDLERLEEDIPAEDIAAVAKLFATAPRIFLLAQHRSFPIVSYLAYALGRLELKTHLLDGVGGMLPESLCAMSPKDVLFVASFRSYSPNVVNAAILAKEKGLSVVSMTDGPLSPLKPTSRICLELVTSPSRTFRSLASPLCLAQSLVVGAGYYLEEHKSDKARKPSTSAKT